MYSYTHVHLYLYTDYVALHCIYVVSAGPMSGLNEEELHASLATVEALASACEADVSVLRQRRGEGGLMADCLVRRRVEEDDFMEVRWVLTGC